MANISKIKIDNVIANIKDSSARSQCISIESNIAAVRETTTTASAARTAGEWLWINDVLYRVSVDIASGAQYITSGAGQNIENITVEDVIEELQNLTEERVLGEVTGNGVKTYGQLLNELYAQVRPIVNSLSWLAKRRILVDTPYGCWYVNAIGTHVLEFYGTHNVLDDTSQKTFFAVKLAETDSRLIRIKSTYDSSTHVLTEEKIENWSNTPAYSGQTFRIELI